MGCFSGVSWPMPDVDHLPPPRVKVNDRCHTYPPIMYLHGVVRDSFALCTVPSHSGKIVLRCLSVTSGNCLMVLGAQYEFVTRK